MADKTNVAVKPETKPGTEQAVQPAGHWDPFAELRVVEADIDRWMNAIWPFARRPVTGQLLRPLTSETAYVPRLDVYQKNGSLVLKAELPGLKPEEVEITVEDGDLIIKGEKKQESEVKEGDYYRKETSYGEFYRRQPLPEGVTPGQIKATLQNGILEVTIPAPKIAKPEAPKIPISTPTT